MSHICFTSLEIFIVPFHMIIHVCLKSTNVQHFSSHSFIVVLSRNTLHHSPTPHCSIPIPAQVQLCPTLVQPLLHSCYVPHTYHQSPTLYRSIPSHSQVP